MLQTKTKVISQISDITPDPHNANKGTQRGRSMIEHSLRNLGAGRSILVDKNGVAIAGNKTLDVAAELNLKVKEIETDGNELIVVKRTDLDLLKDQKAKELAIADNRSSEIGLAWDGPVLAEFNAQGIDLAPWFNTAELAKIVAGSSDVGQDGPDPQLDKAEALRKQYGVELGQVWELGEHRLACGDSTSPEQVDRLLNGAKPFLMVTDPPYGVEYEPDWRNRALGEANRAVGLVSNDERVDWTDAYRLFPGTVAYVWHAGRHASDLTLNLQAAEFQIRTQIIWRKQHFAISRGHYHWQHEPCWYAVRNGQSSKWCGDHSQSTVWEINNGLLQNGGRPDGEEVTGHGTQKPLECMARPIRNHGGKDDDVYDPFVGSGTTIVACENLGRRCYAMEISPAYVAVAIQRWVDLTGKEPRCQ